MPAISHALVINRKRSDDTVYIEYYCPRALYAPDEFDLETQTRYQTQDHRYKRYKFRSTVDASKHVMSSRANGLAASETKVRKRTSRLRKYTCSRKLQYQLMRERDRVPNPRLNEQILYAAFTVVSTAAKTRLRVFAVMERPHRLLANYIAAALGIATVLPVFLGFFVCTSCSLARGTAASNRRLAVFPPNIVYRRVPADQDAAAVIASRCPVWTFADASREPEQLLRERS